MERTLIQDLFMEYHRHHNTDEKEGKIYYNEEDLLKICDKAIEHFEKVQQEAIKEGKVWEDIGSGGKIELLTEMKAFFEHKT